MDELELLRALPKVDDVLRREAAEALVARHGRPLVLRAVRRVLEAARSDIRAGRVGEAGLEALTGDAALAAEVERQRAPGLAHVINATGVVLHTNLGRAPLSAEALQAVVAAAGYASLELDLATGDRGRRETHVSAVASELLGCEAATVVNNCAAAVMIVLRALAEGREVIVSRGELVEIGGGFRIPEVLAQSGCRLVEVGTTNRTRLEDYERAVSPDTALLLKVHRSNFAVLGFTEEVDVAGLSALGRRLGLPVVHDLGSGLAGAEGAPEALAGERTAQESLDAGADLVCFSGDKLLGGPQAGIVAGRGELVRRVHAHPLMRALRCDKLTLAALEATLRAWRDGREETLPVQAMLRATPERLAGLGRELAGRLGAAGVPVRLVEVEDAVGGGSAPLARLPGYALELAVDAPDRVAAALRAAHPPVVGVVRDGRLRLHLRTLLPGEDAALVGHLTQLLGG